MRKYAQELESRVAFLRQALADSGASGFVFNNSGGKDCALTGILCKKACGNTVGLCLPCHARRNFGEDLQDALALSERFGIEARQVDLTQARAALESRFNAVVGDRKFVHDFVRQGVLGEFEKALARLEVREDTLDRPGLLREDPVLQARVLGLMFISICSRRTKPQRSLSDVAGST